MDVWIYVVICGDDGVGKSTIIDSFPGNEIGKGKFTIYCWSLTNHYGHKSYIVISKIATKYFRLDLNSRWRPC